MKIPHSLDENSPSAVDDVSESIWIQKQNDPTKKTLQEVEATISDPAASFIHKTRARLELALLQGEDDSDSNGKFRIKKEIDAIKVAAGVAKTKDKLVQGILSNEEILQREKSVRSHQDDLSKEALQRRIDANRKAEEQRKKATDAQELLSQLEQEAEEAIAKAKDAMKRANAAWVEAGREHRKALELEAQNEEIQHMEDDRANHEEIEQDKINILDDTTSQRIISSEGYFTKYFKLSIKVEELQKDRDELDARLKEREATIESLRGKHSLHEEKIMSLNKLKEQKIMSFGKYLKETGQTLLFWKHQSKTIAEKLQMSRQQKSEQEEEVMIMKDQLDIKLKELDELQAEIEDLRQTKDRFEAELPTVEDTQRSKLFELKEEADALLQHKEQSLNTLRIVHNSHSKVLVHHEQQIKVLSDDVAAYEKEFEEMKEIERDVAESDTMQNDEVKELKEECSRWKKKATSLNLKLDVFKDETQSQKREIARLKKSADQDRLFSRLLSDHKLLKKKAKDLQLNLCVIKKEVRERDVKVKERDAIIDELKKHTLPTDSASLQEGPDAGRKSATYWKYEANKLQEKLTKLERQSKVRDAMMEISSEISGIKKRQTQEYGLSLGSASISFDIEEINVEESHEHDVSAICGEDDMVKPTQVSP
ncbi:hypothetical protein QTG54_010774 [Skeletonema marinoi]|uniref:Uncharacterized protein n=1 Tax=Skeletonema marinoi TaxID=267567 RepID=A0AAD8Y328_9STRA|nr:hypothetical protein QTG54_010774 [Skeletonema marinoi]